MNDSSRGGTFGREVQAMGDAEQLKDPKSESLISSAPEPRENLSADEAQSASTSGSQSKPSVRRSSIRPAPADYRPSVRDPSTMRPMMVVRAGDAEPAPARLDISTEKTKQPPQVLLNADRANVEPSVPAEALGTNGRPVETSLAIPKAPTVPADLALEIGDFGERSASVPDSTKLQNTSKRTVPSLIFAAFAGIALVSVVVVLRDRVSGVKPRSAQQPVSVEQGPRASPAIAETQSAPNIQERVANVAAPETAAPKQGASEPAPRDAMPAPVASAALASTRVSLSLRPVDAKVYVRGREVPGPPYEFDIAKGEHVAVEVVRFGYVTARVVLDDKKPTVTFGMLRERWKKQH
jgi:hypothetical protein